MRQTLLLLTTACVLSAGTALAQTPPPDPTPPTANDQPGATTNQPDGPPPADPTPPTPLPGLEEPTEPPASPESQRMDDAGAASPRMERGPDAMGGSGHRMMPYHGRAMHHGMYGAKSEEGASLRMRVRGMQIEVECGADPIEACVRAIAPLLDKAMAMPRGPREMERRGEREERRSEERDRERYDDRREDDRDNRERDDRDRDREDWN